MDNHRLPNDQMDGNGDDDDANASYSRDNDAYNKNA